MSTTPENDLEVRLVSLKDNLRHGEIQQIADALKVDQAAVSRILNLNQWSYNLAKLILDQGYKIIRSRPFDLDKDEVIALRDQLGHGDHQRIAGITRLSNSYVRRVMAGELLNQKGAKKIVNVAKRLIMQRHELEAEVNNTKA